MSEFIRPSSASTRYISLDGYRFIAAACVVLYHYNMDFKLDLARWTDAADNFYMMVDFFFLLSGFVIATAYKDRMESGADYVTFLRARIGRIYPLHIATLCMSLSLLGASHLFNIVINNPEILSLSGLPANLMLLHAWGTLGHNSFNVPSWSISAEWFVYLSTPILFWLGRRLTFLSGASVVAAFIALMAFIRSTLGWDWSKATYDFGALRALPTFFLGVVIAYAMTSQARFSRTILAKQASPLKARFAGRWWVTHSLFLAVLLLAHFGARTEFVIAALALLIANAARAEQAGVRSLMTTRLMAKLGDASYSIYMLHTLASIPVLFALRKFGLLGTPAAAASALATFLLVVGLSIIVHRSFEAPMRRWIARAPTSSRAEIGRPLAAETRLR